MSIELYYIIFIDIENSDKYASVQFFFYTSCVHCKSKSRS